MTDFKDIYKECMDAIIEKTINSYTECSQHAIDVVDKSFSDGITETEKDQILSDFLVDYAASAFSSILLRHCGGLASPKAYEIRLKTISAVNKRISEYLYIIDNMP